MRKVLFATASALALFALPSISSATELCSGTTLSVMEQDANGVFREESRIVLDKVNNVACSNGITWNAGYHEVDDQPRPGYMFVDEAGMKHLITYQGGWFGEAGYSRASTGRTAKQQRIIDSAASRWATAHN